MIKDNLKANNNQGTNLEYLHANSIRHRNKHVDQQQKPVELLLIRLVELKDLESILSLHS